jgi:hypothetical protein
MQESRQTRRAYFWDYSLQRYSPPRTCTDEEIRKMLRPPSLLGITRELALQDWGSWISPLFMWTLPFIGFAPAQQRLLLSALRGLTDEELSNELSVSPSTVKNTWRSISDLVDRRVPKLLPSALQIREECAGLRRGKEKRQRLLTYLREHPEELRPFKAKPRGKQ